MFHNKNLKQSGTNNFVIVLTKTDETDKSSIEALHYCKIDVKNPSFRPSTASSEIRKKVNIPRKAYIQM